MILIRILNIILIISLLLLLPLAEPAESVLLIRNTVKEVSYNVHTPIIKITVSENEPVTINIYKYSVDNKELYQIYADIIIQSSAKIEFKDPGLYLFSLISPSTNDVEIKGIGVFSIDTYIIYTLLLANLIGFGIEKFKHRNEI